MSPQETLAGMGAPIREAFRSACETGYLDPTIRQAWLNVLVKSGFFDEKSWKVTPLGYEAIGVRNLV